MEPNVLLGTITKYIHTYTNFLAKILISVGLWMNAHQKLFPCVTSATDVCQATNKHLAVFPSQIGDYALLIKVLFWACSATDFTFTKEGIYDFSLKNAALNKEFMTQADLVTRDSPHSVLMLQLQHFSCGTRGRSDRETMEQNFMATNVSLLCSFAINTWAKTSAIRCDSYGWNELHRRSMGVVEADACHHTVLHHFNLNQRNQENWERQVTSLQHVTLWLKITPKAGFPALHD